MTDHPTGVNPDGTPEGGEDVNTEAVNDGVEAAPAQAGAAPAPGPGEASDMVPDTIEGIDELAAVEDQPTSDVHPDTALAAERLADLQRLQAEYVNYKRRVDRDRAGVQERAVRDVLEALLPVLDEVHLARQHGDLTDGPFASIAEKLEATLGRFKLERFGSVGEEFDPNVHEALMHAEWDASNPDLPTSAAATTVVQVLQPGYRAGEQVIRPARVAVADPS